MKTHSDYPISFIICGIEHSGTTLVSDIFREHPSCESGFECGVLLGKSPIDFLDSSPYFNNMIKGWEIDERHLRQACQTEEFPEFYRRVIKHSRLTQDSQRDIFFDKTPRYITKISNILSLTRLPIIAVIKDPRSIAASDFKRSNAAAENIELWYEQWLPNKKNYMRNVYEGYLRAWADPASIVVRLEDLCLRPEQTAATMFEHVGLSFSMTFLDLKRKRYANTRNNGIVSSTCVAWSGVLPLYIQERVRKDFGEFDRWFFNFY